eukprot:scaffold692_cov92-Isochrysis_galbana.AAC.4
MRGKKRRWRCKEESGLKAVSGGMVLTPGSRARKEWAGMPLSCVLFACSRGQNVREERRRAVNALDDLVEPFSAMPLGLGVKASGEVLHERKGFDEAGELCHLVVPSSRCPHYPVYRGGRGMEGKLLFWGRVVGLVHVCGRPSAKRTVRCTPAAPSAQARSAILSRSAALLPVLGTRTQPHSSRSSVWAEKGGRMEGGCQI